MPSDNPEHDIQRVVRDLSDTQRLSSKGVNAEWINSCAELVAEFQRLQLQFQKLESQVSSSGSASSDDTILL